MKMGDIVLHRSGQEMEIMSIYSRKQPGGLTSQLIVSCRWTDEAGKMQHGEFTNTPGEFSDIPP